jgi:hypothetical protein
VELLSSFAEAIIDQWVHLDTYGEGQVKEYNQQRFQHRIKFAAGGGYSGDTWLTLIEHRSRPMERAETFRVDVRNSSDLPSVQSGTLYSGPQQAKHQFQ